MQKSPLCKEAPTIYQHALVKVITVYTLLGAMQAVTQLEDCMPMTPKAIR
jgi:hypothetical protein